MENPSFNPISSTETFTPPHASNTKSEQVRLLSESPEGARVYQLTTDIDLRDNLPKDKRLQVIEPAGGARCRTGNLLFDALYAMAMQETAQNSVSCIQDADYSHGQPMDMSVYKTGEKWDFVWTRDLAYALHLGLAPHDTERALTSLRFKASHLKVGIQDGFANQIVQDTGSGGSYPVSTDRVVWALGAYEVMNHLSPKQRTSYIAEIYPILRDTIEQDRILVFDKDSGLYRGEQSFLDWREQTYPQWTENDTLAIAMSKTLSVNALNVFILRLGGSIAAELGYPEESKRYRAWVHSLHDTINQRFYDEKAGLYRTYLLSEYGEHYLALPRYDLLGQSLAILLDIASEQQTRRILDSYPNGPHGPAVAWPQESNTPIYHNQSIWPFVTAYWVKAAVKAGHTAAVNAGIQSLMKLSAANLSNMENFDFVSGKAYIKTELNEGPTINSRRQLWSVAGYLSIVQNVIFGLHATESGIRIEPFVTQSIRTELFADTDSITLANTPFLNTINTVTIHLPEASTFVSERAKVTCVLLNGREVTASIVRPEELQSDNQWDVYLESDEPTPVNSPLRVVNVYNQNEIYTPRPPEWDDDKGGVRPNGGLLKLFLKHPATGSIVFDVYRNGKLHAIMKDSTEWLDLDSDDFSQQAYVYHLVARCQQNGLVSHPTRGRRYLPSRQKLIIGAHSMNRIGGSLIDKHHFEDWGLPDHQISVSGIRVNQSGRYAIQVSYANGSGPINTGITCAVKKLEINAPANELNTTGYLVMPQTGGWEQYQLSNSIIAELDTTQPYALRISEDPYSRNMSYLDSNVAYTARVGGSNKRYNFVNIAEIRISYIGFL
ncbi:hypothetical protein [Cerasicoccus arenae]|uniref:Uncharacterized protein n=1 Tax=Cerasicoccus arenae TaxID=424488 RepID=A0A8J3DDF3_9BACT|nr:hypothetical protein [Cerasicoccus arenae]MBK1858038.1 hypothetical protein [Cerasicoccus arenae]GHC06665.1 hypothetical protein GCM10007047_24610 [Cerasicoccus arenae]